MLPQRGFVRLGERVHPVFRSVPADVRERARENQRGCDAAHRDRLARPPIEADTEPHPDGRQRQPCRDQHHRDEHCIESNQTVLEFRDHRRRCVRSDPLPDAALHGGDEADDPGADRHAQGHDRRGRRMLGHRRGRGRQRHCQARVQHVPDARSNPAPADTRCPRTTATAKWRSPQPQARPSRRRAARRPLPPRRRLLAATAGARA